MIEALGNPDHEWVGADFDPEAVDLTAINTALAAFPIPVDAEEPWVRLTEQEAQLNLRAVLELCAAGEVRCSEKTGKASAADAEGQAALRMPPAEVLRSLWQRWLTHAGARRVQLDRGDQGPAGQERAQRRQACRQTVATALAGCPADE